MLTPDPEPAGNYLHPDLLEILICPITRNTLSYNTEKKVLFSEKDGRIIEYQLKNGIPIMLVPNNIGESGASSGNDSNNNTLSNANNTANVYG